MFAFEIMQMLYRRRLRWGLVLCLLFLLSFLMTRTSTPDLVPVSVWDFMESALTQQFNCMIIIPILFIFMIVDLAIDDFKDNYIVYTITRTKTRLSWWFAKMTALLTAAILYTLLILLIYFLSGLVSGHSLTRTFSEHAILTVDASPLFLMIIIWSLYVFILTAIGAFVVLIALLTRSALLSWLIGALLCCLSYGSFMSHNIRSLFPYMPSTQLFLLAHLPNKIIPVNPNFTFGWSLGYGLTLLLLSLFLGGLRIRSIHLTKPE